MANHRSALKRHIQSLKKNAQNRASRARLATQVKKARAEIGTNVAKPDAGEVQKAVSLLAKAGRKNVIHPKAASRRISRLMSQAAKA
jgi:small subunit ribosomal protein S20